MAERLTPRTPDLEVQGSSLARRVVSLDKELYCTLSLSTQVYKCWGVTLRWTSIPSRGEGGGVTILVCTFTIFTFLLRLTIKQVRFLRLTTKMFTVLRPTVDLTVTLC